MAAKVMRKRDYPLYATWNNIRQRTGHKSHPSYVNYGGRGIKLHPEWYQDFFTFNSYVETTLGPRPHGMSLDRLDNTGDYVPGNIRWATKVDQSVNRRSTIFLEFRGETMCLTHWASRVGVGVSTLFNRYRLGWSTEEILMTPMNAMARPRRVITFAGRSQGLCVWAKELGISHKTLSGRLDRGWSLDKALAP